MVERTKDKEDLALEALFASEPIADDGFSVRVVKRVRRRIWLRRLALPVAAALGIVVAAKSAMSVIAALDSLATVVPTANLSVPMLDSVPQLSMWLVITAVTIAGLMMLPALDD